MNKVVIEVDRKLTDEKICKKASRANSDILTLEQEIEDDYEEEEVLDEEYDEEKKGNSSKRSFAFCTIQPFKDSDIHSDIDQDNMELSRDLQKYLDSTENHNYDDNFEVQQVINNGEEIRICHDQT